MTRPLALAAGALVFMLLATANSGGYRYGISDQAFYQPAVAISVNPSLFPRDRVVIESQTQLWLGDTLLGWAARLTGGDLPALFAIVYLLTLAALFTAATSAAPNQIATVVWTTAAAPTSTKARPIRLRTRAASAARPHANARIRGCM